MRSGGVTIGKRHALRLNCSCLLPGSMVSAPCLGGLARDLTPQRAHPPLTTSLLSRQLPQEPLRIADVASD